MKKHVQFTAVLVFLLSNFSFAQENKGKKIIEIPLQGIISPSIDHLEVRKREPVVIKFTGINPLKYNYALNHEFVNLFSDNPVDLGSQVFPMESNGSPQPNLKEEIEMQEEKKSVLNSEVERLSNITISNTKAQKEQLFFRTDSLNEEILKIEKQIDSLKTVEEENLMFFTKLFEKYPVEIVSLGINSNPENNSELKNSRIAYRLIEEKSKKIKQNIDLEIAGARISDELDKEGLMIRLTNQYNWHKSNFSVFIELSTKFPFVEDTQIQEYKKSIKSNFEEIEKSYLMVSSLPESIQTPPIDYHGENIDFIKVSLEVVPIDEKAKPINRIQNYEYKVWIKGGLKIDFSAGLFISSLRDNSFLAVQQESQGEGESSLYRIIEEDKGIYEFGVGSTVNFTYRSSRFANFGGSVGGYVTSDQKFRLVLGPTLVLGKMDRLIFSAGIAMGEVTALSSKVNLEDVFDLGTDGSVPTVQKFDFGHYFSFTYNLGKAKSKEQ